MMKIRCVNNECKYRNDNTKLCTKENVRMVSDHWNRPVVVCYSVRFGAKAKRAYYTPGALALRREIMRKGR